MMCVQMLIVVDNGPSVNVSDEIIGDNNCFVSLYYCVFLALVVCFSLQLSLFSFRLTCTCTTQFTTCHSPCVHHPVCFVFL